MTALSIKPMIQRLTLHRLDTRDLREKAMETNKKDYFYFVYKIKIGSAIL